MPENYDLIHMTHGRTSGDHQFRFPPHKGSETMARTAEDGQNGIATTPLPGLAADITASLAKSPPRKSPSLLKQAVRFVLFVVWFDTACLAINATQFIGAPIALWDKNVFYA